MNTKNIHIKVTGRNGQQENKPIPINPNDTLADIKAKLNLGRNADIAFVSENRGGSLPDQGPVYDYIQQDEVFQANPGLQLGV